MVKRSTLTVARRRHVNSILKSVGLYAEASAPTSSCRAGRSLQMEPRLDTSETFYAQHISSGCCVLVNSRWWHRWDRGKHGNRHWETQLNSSLDAGTERAHTHCGVWLMLEYKALKCINKQLNTQVEYSENAWGSQKCECSAFIHVGVKIFYYRSKI